MALYRCAACGSPNVVTDTQVGGVEYNYVKGVIGETLIGPGGAAAGISNQKQEVFKCPDCGVTLTYPMPPGIRQAIDQGVMDPDARDHLTAEGFPLYWDTLKKQYKNIEDGVGEQILQMRAEAHAKMDEIQAEIDSRTAEEIREKKKAIEAEFAMDAATIDEMQLKWEKASESIIAARNQAYETSSSELNAMYDEKIESLGAEYQNAEKVRNEKGTALREEQSMLQEKLPTIGFFKFAEKTEIKTRLAEIESLISALLTEAEDYKKEYEKRQSALQEEKEKDIQELKSKISADYPLTQSPKIRRKWLDKVKEFMDMNKSYDEIGLIFLLTLEDFDREVTIRDNLKSFQNIISIVSSDHVTVSFDQLAYLARKMREAGLVTRIEKGRKAYISLTPPDEI